MDMASSLILISNPGSASRKYALYDGEVCRARLHVEWAGGTVAATLERDGQTRTVALECAAIDQAAEQVKGVFAAEGVLQASETIGRIGLRIVAPGSYFLADHALDARAIERLQNAARLAPLHVTATLDELRKLQVHFPLADIVGVSDSAFHITKPDYAWNYGLPLHDADRLDIKRFGYHGLSVASVVRTLQVAGKLTPRLLVCHVGSGVSVTAVHNGKSVDTTMGYTPLEGAIMATRSGSIDVAAAHELKRALGFDDAQLEAYLNKHGGLRGLGGSSDLRELLAREADGDHYAHLAIQTYVFSLQKSIGAMAAVLGGADALVFTGTAGERSAPLRHRLANRLQYLDFFVNHQANTAIAGDEKAPALISELALSKPIFVVPTNEAAEMAHQVALFPLRP